MNRVYVVNKSYHDFSAAEHYGELVYLSSGSFKRFDVNNMVRQFMPHLSRSTPADWILPTALNIMNIVACSIFASLHNRLNLLLFKNGHYIERQISLIRDP